MSDPSNLSHFHALIILILCSAYLVNVRYVFRCSESTRLVTSPKHRQRGLYGPSRHRVVRFGEIEPSISSRLTRDRRLITIQWVVSSDCSTSDCEGVQKYTRTPSLSQTDVPFHLNYLVGNVSGTVGAETVTLGEFQVSSQIFGRSFPLRTKRGDDSD